MSKLKNLHLAVEEEEDLYKGYEAIQLDELEEDEEFMRIVTTQQGRSKRLGTGLGRGGRPLGTGFGGPIVGQRLQTGYAAEGGSARPMTSTGAAGFTSAKGPGMFDPMSQSSAGVSRVSVPPLDPHPDDSPEEMIKQLEKKVNQLLEESADAGVKGDYQLALDKAKEASRKERMLCKQRDQADQINLDLTYSVLFNLANQYHSNKLYNEAINTYLLIVKNKLFGSGGRLRVNMGNIYFEQKKYPLAIKNYRMALDQIPDTHQHVRFKILKNICGVYVRMGSYNDAINTYEHIMNEMKDKADFAVAMNLLLCYYAMGDKEKIKRHFQRMVKITKGTDIDEDRYYPTDENDAHQALLVEAIRDDTLRKIEKEEKRKAQSTIMNAAKLIAPVIENSFASGFDWCIEVIKTSPHLELASELEITKALTFLKEQDIPKAIETLKDCGRKDSKMAGPAATNLSFIFFLEGDISQAEKYADMAIQLDHYNPQALVNKGNCLFQHEQYNKARDYYQEALDVEATCFEALFNLGLTHKRMDNLQESFDHFLKMQTIFKNLPQVLYHLGDLCDRMGDFHQAIEWMMQLVSYVPTDPGIHQRLGEMYDNESDTSQAYQYYCESFRYSPTNIDVISWLGAYYMDSQFSDKAIHYFERAALIEPYQVNWQLMVASCHRKIGNYQHALQCYKDIHNRFPDNTDCLKFLIRLCSDMGLREAEDYSLSLRKLEKALEAKKQREESGGVHREVSGKRSNISSSGESSAGVKRTADATYSDPLGQLPERPKTSAQTRPLGEDEFDDADLTDELLPE